MNVGPLAVVSLCVIADDDRAVWFDEQSRAISQADAGPPVGLRLHSVAGIELCVRSSSDSFSSGGPDDADVSFKGHKPGAGGVFNFRDVPEGIAILPDVEGSACGNAAEKENGDYQIDETLLNNPPIIGKATGLIRNHRKSTREGVPTNVEGYVGSGDKPEVRTLIRCESERCQWLKTTQFQAATLPVKEFNTPGKSVQARLITF